MQTLSATARVGFLLIAALGTAAASDKALSNTAQVGEDCPLAHERYSSRSPLLDLLINPAAKAALAVEAPSALKMPFGLVGEWATEPPTFAAILTPAALLALEPDGTAQVARLDAALASVPQTRAAVRARCARYDTDPPQLPAQIQHPAFLVFDKVNGFRDEPSIAAATTLLKAMALRRGWTLVFSNHGATFNARDLARFDAVIWNNVSGDVLTSPQRAAFKAWLEHGGGFAGIHGAAGDPVYFWDWYADTLIGARFIGHPMDPQFQEAKVIVDDPAATITAGLGSGWRMTEEWYSFRRSPRASGAHVLARLDETTYTPIGIGAMDLRMGDHPIAWTRCIGAGRSFYTAIGHRPESYTEEHARLLLEQGIAWAAGLGTTDCLAREGR